VFITAPNRVPATQEADSEGGNGRSAGFFV